MKSNGKIIVYIILLIIFILSTIALTLNTSPELNFSYTLQPLASMQLNEDPPPKITIIYPYDNENLPPNEKSVKIKILTNVNADCQYSTSDFTYGKGINFTHGQGTKIHIFNLTSLSKGKIYTFYYRSKNIITRKANIKSVFHTFGVYNNSLKIITNSVRIFSSESGNHLRNLLDNIASTNYTTNNPKIWNDTNPLILLFKLPNKAGFTTRNYSISYFRFRCPNLKMAPDKYDIYADGVRILSNVTKTPSKKNAWVNVDIPDTNITYAGGTFRIYITSVQGNGSQNISIGDIEIFSTEKVDYVSQSPQRGFIGIPQWWNNLQWAYALHVDDVDDVDLTVKKFGSIMPLTLAIWRAFTPDFGNNSKVISEGHEYGSHGYTHENMELNNYSQGRSWAISSKKFIEKNVIKTSRWSDNTILSLAYPYSKTNYHIAEAVYDVGFRVSGQINSYKGTAIHSSWYGYWNGTYTTRDELDWMHIMRSLGKAVNVSNSPIYEGYFPELWNWTRDNGYFGDSMIHQRDTMASIYKSYVKNDTVGWRCTWGEVRSYYYYYQHTNLTLNSNSSTSTKKIYDVHIHYENDQDRARFWKVPITFGFNLSELDINKTKLITYLEENLKLNNICNIQTMCEGYNCDDEILYLSLLKEDGDQIIISDEIEPVITATSPLNNSINVPLDANIIVAFNKPMNISTVSYTCLPDPTGWYVTWSNNNSTAIYSHNPFASSTIYTFCITSGKDLNGNKLVNGNISNPWSFITQDTVSPTIIAISPMNSSVNIPLNAKIVITFSEPMDTDMTTYTCLPDPNGWNSTWSNNNTVITFSHNLFTSSTSYAFQITSSWDLAGNNLVAGNIPNPWIFTTLDAISPSIIAASPSNRSIKVPLDTNIIVTFSESMDNETITYTCLPDPKGWNSTWSNNNTVITFTHNSFTSSTSYTFQIASGKDLAGNNLAFGNIPNPWFFTTCDAISPAIIAISPLNGSIDIPINAKIIVVFSEPMNATSIIYICTPDPKGWNTTWSHNNIELTFTHNKFDYYTTYTFQIINGEDYAGNNLTTRFFTNKWSFTTIKNNPPIIVSTPNTIAFENYPYIYDVEAVDPEGETLTFNLTNYPEGMLINETTGLIEWTPNNTYLGNYNVEIVVKDKTGRNTTQNFTISTKYLPIIKIENINQFKGYQLLWDIILLILIILIILIVILIIILKYIIKIKRYEDYDKAKG